MLTAAFVPSHHHHHTLFLSSASPPLLPAHPPYFRPTRKSAMSSLEIEPARGRPASISVAAAQVEPLTQNNTTSSASSSHKEDDTYSDIKMSILSNAFFLGGGIAYIVGTSWIGCCRERRLTEVPIVCISSFINPFGSSGLSFIY